MQVVTRGTLSFAIRGEPMDVGFSIVPLDGASSFRLDDEPLRRVSSQFAEKLTEAEIEIVAMYPMRAPRLLRIKDRGRARVASSAQKGRRGAGGRLPSHSLELSADPRVRRGVRRGRHRCARIR